jgi:transposase
MRRLPMRKIKDVLRLHAAGRPARQIGPSVGVGRSTVAEYLRRAEVAGLSWPLPEGLDEAALERLLFPPPPPSKDRQFAEPDWGAVHRELKRPGVTLALLWDEYRGQHPDGYGYSAFCEHYRRWAERLSPVMRQRHAAGERMFVDYSGTGMAVIDPATGTPRTAEIFIAVLGASNQTYAEASWSQALPDWIGAHTRAFAAFGAVPGLVVSDNLKSGVIRACFYEPEVNRSYAEMAAHYGTVILPARPYKPRDKAKVEAAVLLVQRWIVARLRNRRFFSLEELNAAISEEVARLNARVSRHLGASRQQLFETLERPAMLPLPPEPYVHADWRKATAGLDYHVRLEGHHYSVPHELIRQQLWARLTASTVEIFRDGKRVACHCRAAPGDMGATTLNDHRPASHRRYAELTPQMLRERAARIGPATALLVDVILRDRPHPEQGFRSCLGILRPARSHGRERLEAACGRALAINARTMTSVKSILLNRLDGRRPAQPPEAPPITHANIRGPQFFH